MASDSQILALSTLSAEDIFAFYEGKERFGKAAQGLTGRIFVIVLTLVALPGVVWKLGGVEVLKRTPASTAVFGLLPAVLMVVVSLLTKRPSGRALVRYFDA